MNQDPDLVSRKLLHGEGQDIRHWEVGFCALILQIFHSIQA